MTPFELMDTILMDSDLAEDGVYISDTETPIRCAFYYSQTPFYQGYEFTISTDKVEILVYKPEGFEYKIKDKIRFKNVLYTIDGVISDDGSVVIFSVLK